MHWIIQNNLYREGAYTRLIEVLHRENYTFSMHKIVPFAGQIEPDINPEGPVICIGSYGMKRVSQKKGWTPGVFDLEPITFEMLKEKWGKHLLNYDSVISTFSDAMPKDGIFFIKPATDIKYFAGMVTTADQLIAWQKGIATKGMSDDGTGLCHDTLVTVASSKNIYREARFFVVDGKIATFSTYKVGNRVIHDPHVDDYIIDYAQARINEYQPHRAFVIDICVTLEGCKIIEINTLNFSGFYASDMDKLVYALGNMKGVNF